MHSTGSTLRSSRWPALGYEALPPSELHFCRSSAPTTTRIAELVASSGGRIRGALGGAVRAGVCRRVASALRSCSNSGRSETLLDPLERTAGILFVHPGSGSRSPAKPDWWAALADYTAVMQAAYLAWLDRGASRWPALKVVFAMLAGGGPFQLERLRSRGVDTRRLTAIPAYFETSSYGLISLELCLATYGVDRLVHGSVFPVVDPAPTMNAIRAFGKAASYAICGRNPRALLN